LENQTVYGENGQILQNDCDFLVLAAPLEMAQLAQSFPTVAFRTYHHWYVTLVSAMGFSPSFFNQSNPPDSILTTKNATSKFTTCAIIARGTENRKVYKCFSNVQLENMYLETLFEGLYESYAHFWPQTFPEMIPNTKFQPIQMNGVYYLNAMESVAVAMEGSVIAGKNVATLMLLENKK
jgi:hypothetical protein